MTQYNREYAPRTPPANFVVSSTNHPVEVLGQLEPYGS